MKRFGNHKRYIPKGTGPHQGIIDTAAFKYDRFHAALLAAVARAEKEEEFRAQHGPVRVIMKDGKYCDA